MTEPSINVSEDPITVSEVGTVNAVLTITMEEMPAEDAWHLGLAITGLVKVYEAKYRLEAKEV